MCGENKRFSVASSDVIIMRIRRRAGKPNERTKGIIIIIIIMYIVLANTRQSSRFVLDDGVRVKVVGNKLQFRKTYNKHNVLSFTSKFIGILTSSYENSIPCLLFVFVITWLRLSWKITAVESYAKEIKRTITMSNDGPI